MRGNALKSFIPCAYTRLFFIDSRNVTVSETGIVRRITSSYTKGRSSYPDFVQAYAAVVATPWVDIMLGVSVSDERISSIDFLPGNLSPYTTSVGITLEAVRQLQSYFRDPRHRFSVPVQPTGTPFQHRVWNALRRIPAGITRSYGDLALQLASSARAVGGACRSNPIPVIIPCHRIVAAQGLGGFMGDAEGPALQLKQRLLAHEILS